MEVGIAKASIKDIDFKPEINQDPEIVGVMSMAVEKLEDYYASVYRQVMRRQRRWHWNRAGKEEKLTS